MRLKKLLIVVFLTLFAVFSFVAVWAVNVVKKAENPPGSATHTPYYTPSQIQAIIDRHPDVKDPKSYYKLSAIFREDSKIPVAEVKGLNDTEIVQQLLMRYLDHFRALPPEHSSYIKGYTIDVVHRADLPSMAILAAFYRVFPNHPKIAKDYLDIVGDIPHTASDKEVFFFEYTVIPYKQFDTRMVGSPPDNSRIPIMRDYSNCEWVDTPDVGVTRDGTGLTISRFLHLSKDGNFYSIGSEGTDPP